MKKLTYLSLISLALFLFACGPKKQNTAEEKDTKAVNLDKMNEENLLAELKKREKTFKGDEKGMQNGRGRALMDAYVAYAYRFDNYENSADYLFKAGEIAMNLNMTAESIKYFDKVYNDFSDYDKRASALFFKAYVLENQAQNLTEAEKIYTQFIDEYPNHELADDAEYSIKNMGKSPEELIREFEKNDSIKNAQEKAA